jgi:hypothetical protein
MVVNGSQWVAACGEVRKHVERAESAHKRLKMGLKEVEDR